MPEPSSDPPIVPPTVSPRGSDGATTRRSRRDLHRAAGSVPASSARPTTAASAPASASAATSAGERTPAAAITRRPERGDAAHELEVGPGERAVAVDRGAVDARHAGREAARDRVVEREPRALGPAGGADLAVADVERDDEPLAERLDPRRRIRERGRADDDAVGARREQRRGVLDASGCRRRPGARRRGGSATARTSSGRTRPERAPSRSTRWIAPRARLGEAPRERDRLARPLDDVVVVALVQPHRALAEHVHGGDHLDRLREPLARSTPPC